MSAATQVPDTAPGPYYVSVVRDGSPGDFRPVSGPYQRHVDALANVEPARRLCERMDPKAVWYSFGTVRMKDGYAEPGILQRTGHNLDLTQGDA